MILSTAITLLILSYMWIVIPWMGVDHGASAAVLTAVLGLCAWAHRRHGADWGFQRSQLRPALRWTLLLTLPAVAVLLAVGWWIDTFQPRDGMALRFLALLAWALVQQFILQTVILREARRRFGRWAAFTLAAGLFAVIHLPNPFLTPATFAAGLAWCWIYDRHPNLLPIALSHAAASLAAVVALGPGITGGMRVGYGYFLQNGIWF